jgi:hypothetical protein
LFAVLTGTQLHTVPPVEGAHILDAAMDCSPEVKGRGRAAAVSHQNVNLPNQLLRNLRRWHPQNDGSRIAANAAQFRKLF